MSHQSDNVMKTSLAMSLSQSGEAFAVALRNNVLFCDPDRRPNPHMARQRRDQHIESPLLHIDDQTRLTEDYGTYVLYRPKDRHRNRSTRRFNIVSSAGGTSPRALV